MEPNEIWLSSGTKKTESHYQSTIFELEPYEKKTNKNISPYRKSRAIPIPNFRYSVDTKFVYSMNKSRI